MSIEVNNFLACNPIDVYVYDLETKYLLASIKQIQTGSVKFAGESTDLLGRGGRLLKKVKKSKSLDISITNGEIVSGMLALQFGDDFKKELNKPFPFVEMAEVIGNKIKPQKKVTPRLAGAPNFVSVNVEADPLRALIEDTTSATTDKFTFDDSTNTMTFDGLSDGTKVFLRYYTLATEQVIMSNLSNKFSKPVRLEILTEVEEACEGKTYYTWIIVDKADISSNLTLDFGDTGAVHSMEFSGIAGCGQDLLCQFFMANEKDLEMSI